MYIRLKDKGTIFHDASQGVTVTGTAVVEVKSNGKIQNAIKGGIIEEVSEEVYKNFQVVKSGAKVEAKTVSADKVDALKAEVKAKDEELESQKAAHQDEVKSKDEEIAKLKEELAAKEPASTEAKDGAAAAKAAKAKDEK